LHSVGFISVLDPRTNIGCMQQIQFKVSSFPQLWCCKRLRVLHSEVMLSCGFFTLSA
jgi:hypothetical protein